ncbi:hypothetical protein FNV43_RR16211 [Rhamnella rubrinervis]|uniref:Uncharacterized protein n=1 Tax=Rhamnella rubrinervis TaxID=2594499 RepID=A0A8K0E353_9ROSA|nr:hypothetical protein FNV43_RR16211 [Rhamnella rubrinervis]
MGVIPGGRSNPHPADGITVDHQRNGVAVDGHGVEAFHVTMEELVRSAGPSKRNEVQERQQNNGLPVTPCNAFKRGLLPGTKIYDYMVRKKPRNLLQTLQKAQNFVVLEEETALDMQRATKEGRIESTEAIRAAPIEAE